MLFKRPDSVPVGQVWSRFKGRERDGKPAKMYQVRDMEDKDKKRCLDLMQETFIQDEPLSQALGIPNDPVSISTIRSNWESFVSQGVSLACYTEVDGEPDELVGFNVVMVKCREDVEELYEIEGEGWKKLLKTLTVTEELVNVFKYYNVDKYLTSSGLTVLPEHRGQNIGARLFEAREPLCKALGIKVSCTVYTAITSQVLAKKCGYETLAELNYSDMLQYGVDLSGCTTKSAKLMAIEFNF